METQEEKPWDKASPPGQETGDEWMGMLVQVRSLTVLGRPPNILVVSSCSFILWLSQWFSTLVLCGITRKLKRANPWPHPKAIQGDL